MTLSYMALDNGSAHCTAKRALEAESPQIAASYGQPNPGHQASLDVISWLRYELAGLL